ncbi:hypothetical protein DRQ50_13130, partial [bacterium]
AHLYQEELGDYRQAVEAYDHALAAGDAPATEIRYRQGECHEKGDRMEGALVAYESSADAGSQADPFRIASLARLAEIAEERGNWSSAIGYWQTIADSGGKPEWVQMAQDRIAALTSSGVTGS